LTDIMLIGTALGSGLHGVIAKIFSWPTALAALNFKIAWLVFLSKPLEEELRKEIIQRLYKEFFVGSEAVEKRNSEGLQDKIIKPLASDIKAGLKKLTADSAKTKKETAVVETKGKRKGSEQIDSEIEEEAGD